MSQEHAIVVCFYFRSPSNDVRGRGYQSSGTPLLLQGKPHAWLLQLLRGSSHQTQRVRPLECKVLSSIRSISSFCWIGHPVGWNINQSRVVDVQSGLADSTLSVLACSIADLTSAIWARCAFPIPLTASNLVWTYGILLRMCQPSQFLGEKKMQTKTPCWDGKLQKTWIFRGFRIKARYMQHTVGGSNLISLNQPVVD